MITQRMHLHAQPFDIDFNLTVKSVKLLKAARCRPTRLLHSRAFF